MANFCDDELVQPYDVACNEYATDLIEGVYYSNSGKPIVVPSGAGEYNARFMTELARRLALDSDDAEQICYVETKNAVMNPGTPATKIDPHNNVQIISPAETDMRIEGVEYRNNKEIYDFWKDISERPRNYTSWFKQGGYIVGAEAGFSASFSASAAIVSGNNMPNQINYGMNWKGSTMPPKVLIPV